MSTKRTHGHDAMVIKGVANLCEAVVPQVGSFTLQQLANSGFYSYTLPMVNIPMHPLQFQCDRLYTLFNSFIRWKAISLSVEYVPSCGTDKQGSILMGFTSCMADGGAQGVMAGLKTAISDLPGSVEIPIGLPGKKCTMTFIDAFDWNFTCLKGGTLNEVYSGAFVAAVTGPADMTNYSYLGDFRIHYEIALREPAAVLSIPRGKMTGKWFGMQSTNIVAGDRPRLRLNPDSSPGANDGDILQLTYMDPVDAYSAGSTQAASNYLRFGPPGSNTTAYGKKPKNGQTIYGRVQSDVNDVLGKYVNLYAGVEDAKAEKDPLTASYTPPAVSGTNPTTDWKTTMLDSAKILIPAAVQLAEILI